MAVILKPKSYGALVVASDDQGTRTFTTEGGHRGAVCLVPGIDGSSPSDLMLAALGSCISISLSMAAEQLQMEVSNVRVEVSGTKGTDLPHRISRFDILVTLQTSSDTQAVDQLLKKTKQICTISNTIAADVVLNWNRC